MAQLVKLEPGDVLVLANIGADEATLDSLTEMMPRLREILQLDHILVFEGNVDLSKVSADAVAGG